MDEFLKSKSMVTPLVAGATTTMLTGTVVKYFNLPGAWTALAISLAIGLLAWADRSVPLIQRILLYILNSITILTVSTGLNEAGVAATRSLEPMETIERSVPRKAEDPRFFTSWFR
ncbi:MAG: hypothetical protein QNJ87_15650 [Gammaproteobacteria bacterium]|nr:hypothetical protein [Gammaproteobacteria bacterium]MDJ0891579.1 hypothetical protein [Gammaproteobacteria bacterium]